MSFAFNSDYQRGKIHQQVIDKDPEPIWIPFFFLIAHIRPNVARLFWGTVPIITTFGPNSNGELQNITIIH